MSKTKSIFLAIFLFIILSVLLLQIDDDLDPQAQSMYEQTMAHKESKAYIYLLGMQAAVDEKPEVVGKALMASIRNAEKKFFDNPLTQKYEYEGYPNEKSLSLPDLGACTCPKKGCEYTDKLFSNSFDIEALPEEQKVLLKRYKKLIAMRGFHTLSLPHVETVFPPFQYIMKGNSLASLAALEIAKSGNVREAKKLLRDDFLALRSQLQQADTLVGKMIYASAMSRTLDVLSVLIHKYNSPVKDNIQALTTDERSLVKAMNYEYGFNHNTMKSLGKSQSLLSTTAKSKESDLPVAWVNRILYKPNMTLNAIFPYLSQFGQYSLLPPKAFVVKVTNNMPAFKKKSYVRNYIGTILSQINGPNYNQYIARVFSLDAKIHLFNKTSSNTKLPTTLSHISNPFYDDKTAYYSDNKKAICVDVPLLDKRQGLRCLRIK